jgi:acid phosphatase (class A)
MYLRDFVETNPTWFTALDAAASASGLRPENMTRTQLNEQMLQILDLAPERDDRFAEVIDQDDADGAINYWLGMLEIDPARDPATYLMVRVGRRVGEHVVMCLKGYYRSPRPSQLCPALVPMIDPPVTPTFPAGHAVQAYLISYLLAYSLPNFPQQTRNIANPANDTGLLFDLADRVSENRIVAGLHFPTDIRAGKAVAIKCFELLRNVPSVWTAADSLKSKIADEFKQYA